MLHVGWKDVEPPEDTATVRRLLHILDKSCCLEKEFASPPVIHCNSGILPVTSTTVRTQKVGQYIDEISV